MLCGFLMMKGEGGKGQLPPPWGTPGSYRLSSLYHWKSAEGTAEASHIRMPFCPTGTPVLFASEMYGGSVGRTELGVGASHLSLLFFPHLMEGEKSSPSLCPAPATLVLLSKRVGQMGDPNHIHASSKDQCSLMPKSSRGDQSGVWGAWRIFTSVYKHKQCCFLPLSLPFFKTKKCLFTAHFPPLP